MWNSYLSNLLGLTYLIQYNPVLNTMHQSQICHCEDMLHHKINVTGHLLLPFVLNYNHISKILLSQSGKILGVIEVHPQFPILHSIPG